MSSLLEFLGVDVGSNLSVFGACTIFTFAAVTIIWAIGLQRGHHSLIDSYYGFGYVLPALLAYYAVNARSVTAALLLFMVILHGGRLGWYLSARNARWSKELGGDPKYLDFARDLRPGYWWKSLIMVMEPQAVVIVIIGLPSVVGILENRQSGANINAIALIGILVFGVGSYFEWLADGQLQAFLANKENNKNRYLSTGVWTHTRHPNYFGNTCVWWGIWLVAISGNFEATWWTAAGPLVNTIMLTRVLGSTFADNRMGKRPEYQLLMARTRRFLPIPLPRKTVEEQQRIVHEHLARDTDGRSESR